MLYRSDPIKQSLLYNLTTTEHTMTTQERQQIKDWGRTVVRLRREGSFADLLHAEIKVSHLTVKEIAAACNTSSASVNKWKAGEVYPAAHLLYRLARCLHPPEDVSSAYMLYTMKINAERD